VFRVAIGNLGRPPEIMTATVYDRSRSKCMVKSDLDSIIEVQIPALRRFAYALTREHDAADDLVQDCLEKALSRRQFEREPAHLRARLFGLLRSIHLERLRRQQRQKQILAFERTLHQTTPAGTGDGTEVTNLLAALDLLPEEPRSLLLLIGVEDFSYVEAAEVLGLPIGTVMSRLSRARQKLRLILDRDGTSDVRRIK
jgi:RNA polymerase sigma factor (sigma-70 family)